MTYCGIDVGRKGAIALIDSDLGILRVWEMPGESNRGIDLLALDEIIKQIPQETKVWIEWNMCRPHDVPDYAMRFGIQEGQIRAMFFARLFEIDLISPMKWMNFLGLPGKDDDHNLYQRRECALKHYPNSERFFTGPRGGILDGPLEAILIAHACKMCYTSPVGFKSGPRKPRFRGIPND